MNSITTDCFVCIIWIASLYTLHIFTGAGVCASITKYGTKAILKSYNLNGSELRQNEAKTEGLVIGASTALKGIELQFCINAKRNGA